MSRDTSSHDDVLVPDDFREKPKGTDKRREPRFACLKMLNVLPCSARDEWHFETVELTDCSLNGIGFTSPSAMRPNEQILVKLLLRKRLRMLIYTIRHCKALPKRRYAIGAEFSGYVAAPNDEDPQEILAEMLRNEP